MERKILEGKLIGNKNGYAFLVPNEKTEKDYFIPHSSLRGALHGDTVVCEATKDSENRTTARVLKILSRGTDRITGTYRSNKYGAYVVPDDERFFSSVVINSKNGGLHAKSGDKVAVKIRAYPDRENPVGIVIKVFGKEFDKNAELNSLFYTYKISQKFPKDVIWEADAISDEISDNDLKNREDFRGEIVFTIDGENAKDFDDAISIKKDGDFYILGVHIADVSHYVKMGGKIDEEAFNRSTSVYFPEHVFPMLPEKLSNGVCSLKEGEDRLTLSCIIKFDKKGKVRESYVTPSIIKSVARTTYTGVQKILDGEKAEGKYLAIKDRILLANDLAELLIKRRDEEGVIDLDAVESEIKIKDKKIEVSAFKQLRAHKIIEEFMISANVCVAEYLFFSEIPCVYRTHGEPELDRLENFYLFLDALGVKYKKNKGKVFSKDFQTILKNTENTPFYQVINRVMLRTMQKAKYSPENLGHFGLSLDRYCHFTSPIRRYPDLTVHRIIKEFIKSGTVSEKLLDSVLNVSDKASKMERNAIEAERAVDDYYKLLYLLERVGEEYNAVISGVTAFGIFAELESGVEGLIKVETLKGNRKYEYNAKRYTLSNGKISFRLGQTVKIKVDRVDLSSKSAEFLLVED